jgi:large subunit ribosomal protein L18
MTRVLKRRHLEHKTDYKARLAMLKSNKHRLVIRKTNRYVIAQIVVSENAQDKVLISATTKDLIAHGWPKEKSGSLKSLAAAYLLGLMVGKKALSKTKEAIIDIGMNRNIQKSRIYAVVKGALDSGLHIPHNADSLPNIEMIKSNKHLSTFVEKLKEKM